MLAWCNHGLREHLETTARIIALEPKTVDEVAKRAEARNLNIDTRRLRREITSSIKRFAEALGVGESLAHALFIFSGYAHDIGKALGVYQERLRNAGGECEVSLAGHETWSAWVAYHALYEALRNMDENQREVLATVSAAGVALHHSARRSLDEALDRAGKIGVSNEELKTLSDLATEGLRLAGLSADAGDIYERLKYDLLSYAPHPPPLALKEHILIKEAVWGELITYAIMLADNLDSYTVRGGEEYHVVLSALSF